MTEHDENPQPHEPVGPVDASVNPRYAGIATFARLPRIEDVPRADVAIVGIPFDTGVSYRPGARFGPSHVRESSRLLRPYNPAQDVSPFAEAQVVDAGDIPANPFDIGEAVADIETAATDLGARVDRIVSVGGDHTIALPLLRALTKKHGPVAVLHFDAHLDTWDTYFGAPITHGTPFRRASEEGLIDLTASCHVGTRGPLYSKQDLDDDERLGFSIVSSVDIEERGVEAAIERVRRRVGDRPLYISIDIDVLDPAHAPGHRNTRGRRHDEPRTAPDAACPERPRRRRRGRGRGVARVRPRTADRHRGESRRLRAGHPDGGPDRSRPAGRRAGLACSTPVCNPLHTPLRRSAGWKHMQRRAL